MTLSNGGEQVQELARLQSKRTVQRAPPLLRVGRLPGKSMRPRLWPIMNVQKCDLSCMIHNVFMIGKAKDATLNTNARSVQTYSDACTAACACRACNRAVGLQNEARIVI